MREATFKASCPGLFHHDPRYFRIDPALGYGIKKRAWLAVKQIVLVRRGSNHRPYISEWSGDAFAVAISERFYPDTRRPQGK